MPRFLNTRFCFVLVCALLLAGCNSSGQLKVNQPLSVTIDHGATAELDVNTVLPDDADEDDIDEANEILSRLRGELFGRLINEGVFKQVYHKGQSENAQYHMVLKVEEVDEVSQGARIFFGALAGANELIIHVTVTDAANQEALTDFTVTGESASHPLSSESGMDSAIREAVDEIILALR